MVLNRLRKSISPLTLSAGKALGRLPVSPTVWTFVGFLFSILAGILYALKPHETYLAAVALVVSGLFDVLDGSVARAMNRVSKSGSFNDSTLDRVSELALFGGIIYGRYVSSTVVLLALGFSLLVSYTRAKGDSLGVILSGIGIGERAERLIVLVLSSLVGFVWLGVYLVLILAGITFFQRYFYILQKLRK